MYYDVLDAVGGFLRRIHGWWETQPPLEAAFFTLIFFPPFYVLCSLVIGRRESVLSAFIATVAVALGNAYQARKRRDRRETVALRMQSSGEPIDPQ